MDKFEHSLSISSADLKTREKLKLNHKKTQQSSCAFCLKKLSSSNKKVHRDLNHEHLSSILAEFLPNLLTKIMLETINRKWNISFCQLCSEKLLELQILASLR